MTEIPLVKRKSPLPHFVHTLDYNGTDIFGGLVGNGGEDGQRKGARQQTGHSHFYLFRWAYISGVFFFSEGVLKIKHEVNWISAA